MYQIRYEGGVSSGEQQAIEAWVPKKVNEVLKAALTVGDALTIRWFGADAARGGTKFADFDAKRKKMDEYVNRKCTVISFVKKPYGAKVDSAVVEMGDFAQVMRNCFKGDPSGFVPSGVRLYLLGSGLINQSENERFNTITHELSHRVIGTTDWIDGKSIYGKNSAVNLAKKPDSKALECAENWGYFYMELMELLAAG